MKLQQKKSQRFAIEIKIVEELRKRLDNGDGWTRIKMKEDGQEIDICYDINNQVLVSFPAHYNVKTGKYPYLNERFSGLDEVAEFLMNRGWMKKFN